MSNQGEQPSRKPIPPASNRYNAKGRHEPTADGRPSEDAIDAFAFGMSGHRATKASKEAQNTAYIRDDDKQLATIIRGQIEDLNHTLKLAWDSGLCVMLESHARVKPQAAFERMQGKPPEVDGAPQIKVEIHRHVKL